MLSLETAGQLVSGAQAPGAEAGAEVRAVRAFWLPGGARVGVGDSVVVSPALAVTLVQSRKAERVLPAPPLEEGAEE